MTHAGLQTIYDLWIKRATRSLLIALPSQTHRPQRVTDLFLNSVAVRKEQQASKDFLCLITNVINDSAA